MRCPSQLQREARPRFDKMLTSTCQFPLFLPSYNPLTLPKRALRKAALAPSCICHTTSTYECCASRNIELLPAPFTASRRDRERRLAFLAGLRLNFLLLFLVAWCRTVGTCQSSFRRLSIGRHRHLLIFSCFSINRRLVILAPALALTSRD